MPDFAAVLFFGGANASIFTCVKKLKLITVKIKKVYIKWLKVVDCGYHMCYTTYIMLGTFPHQLDDKNRIRIPAKLKSELKDNYTLTKGVDGCIYVFAKDAFNTHIAGKLDGVSIGDRAAQKPLRLLMASAFEISEDKQGRIILPAELIKHAGIKKNIVILGVGNRAEVWDEDRWNAYNSDEDFDAAMEGLKEYKI